MKKLIPVIVACTLGFSGCAAHQPPAEPLTAVAASESLEPQQDGSRTGVEVAKDVGKGLLAGTVMCAMPMMYSSPFGPGGWIAGAVLSAICLPFGVTIGAIAGASGPAKSKAVRPAKSVPTAAISEPAI